MPSPVTDRKPPRLAGREAETLRALLSYQRESLVGFYRSTWPRVDAVAFAGKALDELCHGRDIDPPVNLRWVLMHLLEETARHAGHADILRELIDGQVGR
jgi:hypothetical protein